ncbi:MAG: hypothetical protein PHI28_01045 [Mangrovibacterium sp.]|nr:hypothetical protein [Mangrovibacterium sp.]
MNTDLITLEKDNISVEIQVKNGSLEEKYFVRQGDEWIEVPQAGVNLLAVSA